MVITGQPRKVDSVENFLQQNALTAAIVVDGDTTDTASIASTFQTDSSSVQGVVIQLRNVRRPRVPRYPNPTDSSTSQKSGKQRMGHRKWRRYQNNIGLLSGIEEESDPDFLTTSLARDIAEENTSAFSELFSNPSKMEIWEKFVRMSEGQQRKILLQVAEDFDRACHGLHDDEEATSADACFRRIDRQLRHLIAHRSPPVDIIEPMEQEIVGFFEEKPSDVLDVEKNDTYYRMIFHAVCQYFGLKSKSVKSRSTCRTEVRNRSKTGTFAEPPLRLSAYLSQHYE
ncbi:hypothetical protein BV898_12638 [Hypsibius exemplaris]|uniref:R3H-associated N-terminal domain-containing protein n=1 Tax=Hypsibius exemplaris TaxID=2072580 RepID=A0A1W0WD56_HYPEX|nr:hypothetical protein BV898_12638 [Hypsibius exemplaris]